MTTAPVNHSSTAMRIDHSEMKRVMAQTMGMISAKWEKMAEAKHYTLPQRRAFAQTFEQIVGPAPQRVLDVGCGPGLFAQVWAEMGHEVTGLDCTPQMLDRARTRHKQAGLNTTFIEGDAETPPLEDGTFDVVTNRAVIHMLLRPGTAIHRWHRLLKPGGKLVTVNFRPDRRSLKSVLKYVRYRLHRGSKKFGIKYSREEMRTMAAYRESLPFGRTVPKQVFELYAAAGFEDVRYVSDELVQAARRAHEVPEFRSGGYLRYILAGTKSTD